MSKASEWAVYCKLSSQSRPVFRAIAEVANDGALTLRPHQGLSPEAVLEFARWILDIFGDEP